MTMGRFDFIFLCQAIANLGGRDRLIQHPPDCSRNLFHSKAVASLHAERDDVVANFAE